MYRKISLLAVMLGTVFFTGVGISEAATVSSSSNCTPTISAQKVKENSLTLKVTCTDLKSTKTNIKVTVENTDDDSTSTKTSTVTLSKSGVASVKITGLDAAASYSLKIKIKKSSKGTYSSYSNSIDVETKGSDLDPTIDTIKSITESSAKLEVSCEDLESDSVTVQVAYKKKTSWSTKNFDITLDSDGEGSLTMDGLKSDTAYSFKIRIKKFGGSSYSAYSSIKTATTDED